MPEKGRRHAAVSFRLDDTTKRLIELLAEKLGVNRTDVVVMAIREKARREKIDG